MEQLLKDNGVIFDPALMTHQMYDLLLVLGLINIEPLQDSHFGILGWNIPHEPATWVTLITGDDWDVRMNPILLKNNTWVHHSEEIDADSINLALNRLKNSKINGKKIWGSIYPELIELGDSKNPSTPFKKFIEDKQSKVAMVGWEEHMRFVYKDGHQEHQEGHYHLSFYDPWMQHLEKEKFFNRISSSLKKTYGYSSAFIRRAEDQSGENSCVIDSLARCLLVGQFGKEAAFWPWGEDTYDYALLASRMIHLILREKEEN